MKQAGYTLCHELTEGPMRLLLLFIFAFPVYASPVTFKITMTADEVIPIEGTIFPNVGDKFFALVTVDDAILQQDSLTVPGKILDFRARMGVTIWDMHIPSDFAG